MLNLQDVQARPAKTALIWLLSLLAAVVCFGFLRSSGVVKNGAVELGGAFAGFIVSLFALNKVWGKEDTTLEARAAKEGSDFAYAEVVKALDLRQASPHAATQMAPLTDYYRAKRLGNAHTLRMHYATTSDGINFTSSPTHPTALWAPAPVSHIGPRGEVLKREYTLNINLSELAKGETTSIIGNFVYQNAFKKLDREWLETHLEHPTGQLTMIILAPDDLQFTDATGARSVGRDPLEPTQIQPTLIQRGSVIYWSIEDPETGSRYALSWAWSTRQTNTTP